MACRMKPSTKKTTASKAKVRESLHPLQPSATDKENLVGAGRILRASQSQKMKNKIAVSKKTKDDSPKRETATYFSTVSKKTKDDSPKHETATYQDKAIQTTREDTIKIEAEDLTSIAGPSENYWELLAERRRTTLESALEENKELWQRVEKLEEEKRIYEEMLNETRALVEVLQEMINDDRSDINNSLDDSSL